MSEQPPEQGGVGREDTFKAFAELPYYYQCLGKACAEAGLLSEFYEMVEAGFDYVRAIEILRHELQGIETFENVDDFLERFDIPSEFDE